MSKPFEALRLCLISDVEAVQAAVRVSCLPPHTLDVFSLDGFLDADNTVSAYGASVVESAQLADVVLVGWSMQQAPLINTICYAVRSANTFVPIIALGSGGQDEMMAALAAGADDVTCFPLYLPLLQARIAAHHRLTEAVRRNTSKKLKKKLRKRQREALTHIEAQTEALLGDLSPTEHHLETEAEKFVEHLIEDLTERLVDEVNAELMLAAPDQNLLEVGLLRLDATAYRFHVGAEEVELTPKEFELLAFLMAHADTLCTRDDILNRVWGIDFDTGTNMVDVYMHFLRRKLSEHGAGAMLQTIRGKGYRLTAT